MGLSSSPLFAKPSNIVFLPKKMDYPSLYAHYIEDTIIHDIPITTGNFMQKIIDEYEHGIKIYGYLIKDHVKVWECLLTEILEQNPKKNNIEFHFYCGEIGKAFYFKAERERNDKQIVFSIMVGSENDGAYHDITFEDNDRNQYNMDELEEMNREDSIKGLLKNGDDEDGEGNVFANYEFDEKKYKIVYNIQGVEFTEEPHSRL